MKRLNDNFLSTIDAIVDLKQKTVLEIGCGNGKKSVGLADLCAKLSAIDPDADLIHFAQNNCTAPNLTYSIGSAEALKFDANTFDVVIFSLSLHHVPVEQMNRAIEEAARVTKPNGRVVFLEPAFNGSFFDAEIIFGAGDGDERKEKAAAHFALLNSQILTNELEYYDDIRLEFESDQDFVDAINPTKNLEAVTRFLKDHDYALTAQRRINVFSFV